MQTATIDRRTTPRFDVTCFGELVWGDTLVDVEIVDMSITGCGIKILDTTAAGRGQHGILNIKTNHARLGVVLPVVIINHTIDQGCLRCGLEYKRLSKRQMRSLIALLNDVVPD